MNLKLLSVFAVVITINCCAMNDKDSEKKYDDFAKEEITDCIDAMKSDVQRDPLPIPQVLLNKYGSFDNYCEKTSQLLYELAAVVKSTTDDRYECIGKKTDEIRELESYAKFVFSTINDDIISAAWNLLDTEDEYGCFVDPKNPFVKKHTEAFEEEFTEYEDEK